MQHYGYTISTSMLSNCWKYLIPAPSPATDAQTPTRTYLSASRVGCKRSPYIFLRGIREQPLDRLLESREGALALLFTSSLMLRGDCSLLSATHAFVRNVSCCCIHNRMFLLKGCEEQDTYLGLDRLKLNYRKLWPLERNVHTSI